MVRTVKTKTVRSLGKGQRALLLPGPTGAEPWEVWVMSGKAPAELVQTCASPLENRFRKSSTLAFPVAQVYCLPLWLNETDAKLFAGMIPLQLELRGLQPRGNEPVVFDWTVVAQEGGRTLVMVGVLPATFSAEMQPETYETFDLSARYFSFPENALTIWKEQDRLAVAITRGAQLAYYQILAEAHLTPRVLQDLNCIRATLSMQAVLPHLKQVVLWTEVGPPESAALATAMQLPIRQSERPAPVAPTQPWKLTPSTVGEARRLREVQGWQKKGIAVAVVVYLLLVAWMVTRFVLISQKVDGLRKWQTDNAAAVALVHDSRAAWKELEPVVDKTDYPLELLLHAAGAIPADQLHLTLFEAGNGHVLIKGEAKNVAAAFQFWDKLKSDPNLTHYSWSMGQPNILPNDLAQLQIEGIRGGTD